MDELDLVRLARPAVDEPDADTLARLKAAALDASTAEAAVPPGDSDAPDVPIELDVVDAPTPRRRRGLVLTSIAAAVLTVGGGIAIATRDRGTDRTAGSADTSIAAIADGDTGDATALAGTWRLDGIDLGVAVPAALPPLTMTFAGASGGYGITVCTTLVGSKASVRDGHLVIDDTPSGIEGGCNDETERAFQDRVIGFLLSRPAITVEGNRLALRSGPVFLTFVHQSKAAASPANVLDGRTYTVTSLRDGETVVPLELPIEVSFTDVQVVFDDHCNGPTGTLEVVDGKLVVSDVLSRLKLCPGDVGAQDAALLRLLATKPVVQVAGNEIQLSGGGVTLIAVEIASPATTPPPATTAAPAANVLDGSTFTITKLTDGETDVPVEASGTLAFVGGKVRVKVGCNDAGGDVASADTTLVIYQLASTAMGCPTDEATVREELVKRLLTSRPSIQLADGQLRLAAGRIVLLAVDRDAATSATTAVPATDTPTVALTGTTLTVASNGTRADLVEGPPLTLARSWVTNGRVQRGVLSYAGLRASLVLFANGSFLYDGCVNREGTYTADATTFALTLVRPQQGNKPALDCTPEQRAEEEAFFADVDRPRTYAFDGTVLTITGPDGNSERFKAAS